MKRRTYLGLGAAGGLSVTAGCLGTLGLDGSSRGDNPSGGDGSSGPDSSSETVLAAPENRGDPIHPIYGETIPSFSVTDALSGETVTNETFEGNRTQLYTFVYTNCPDGVCPALLQRLYTPSKGIREAGYESEAAYIPITFDPRRDTPDVIQEYVQRYNIDPDAESWHFLRPESQDAAYDLVFDTFGLPIEETQPDETEDDGTQDDDGSNAGSNESEGTTDADSEYYFTHYALILLVNDQGIVERSYPNATGVSPQTIEEDMLAVIEG